MIQGLAAFWSWFFLKDEKEQIVKLSFIKSILLFGLIILAICEYYWNTMDDVRKLLGENILSYIGYVLKIGIYFFTVYAIIALFFCVFSYCSDRILQKLNEDDFGIRCWEAYLGAKRHFENCLEDILIISIGVILLDKTIFEQYKLIFNDLFWFIWCFLMFVTFITSMFNIIKRFVI